MCFVFNCLVITCFRVQTVSDILSAQVKWNQSNDFSNEPIEILFEISQVN